MKAQRSVLISLAALALIFSGAPAHAGDGCLADAKGEYKDCTGTCKEDYQSAKDACLNRDHACVEVCRAQRADCRDATGIDGALDACNDTLASARQQCRDTYPAGSADRDACIDQAQVVAFQCRDQARENAKKPLKACRAAFRSCAAQCGPPAPGDGSAKQCKADALAAYKSCGADCREGFQVEKDACKNRDHACVEQCRSDRADCRAPINEQLRSDEAQCKATRDQAVDNCKSLYAEGTPERTQCIDNAQVAAFECRDQARENAHPGYAACRQQFQSCAQACPPPAE